MLIRAERDSLLKKNAKAKERLRDLAALRQEKVRLEQDLADVRKKYLESEKVLKLKQKDLLDAQKRNTNLSTTKNISLSKQCAQCKVKEKAKQELLERLNRAEKETLEIKNEKM